MESNPSAPMRTRLFGWWMAPLLAYAVLEFLGLRADGFITSGNRIRDADTMMRLAIIRQAQATGGFHHGFFPRDNAPYGFAMHWTLPFNWLVLGLSKLFDLFMPGQGLEQAGYWTGPLLSVAIALASYRLARQIMSRPASACASAMILFSPAIFAYGRNGTANHHILMCLDSVVLLWAALRALRRPDDARGAILMGLVGAFCLWTTAELLILVGPAFMLLFGLWAWEGRRRTAQILFASATFSIGVSLALLVDPPYGGLLDPAIDRLSVPYAILADVPFFLAFLAWRLPLDRRRRRSMLLAASGLICGVAWLLAFPQAPDGVEGALGPYLRDEWASRVAELQSVTDWRHGLMNLGTGILSLLLIIAPRLRRREKIVLSGLLAVLVVMLWTDIASGITAQADEGLTLSIKLRYLLTVLPIIIFVPYFGKIFVRRRPTRLRVALLGLFCILLALAWVHTRLTFYLIMAAALYLPHRAGERWADRGISGRAWLVVSALLIAGYTLPGMVWVMNKEGASGVNTPESTCQVYPVAALLNDPQWLGIAKPRAIFLDDLNETPELLFWTNNDTVAGNYHPNRQGLYDTFQFMRATDDRIAQDIAARRGVDFVLFCERGVSSFAYTSNARFDDGIVDGQLAVPFDPTVYSRLWSHRPPPWLKPRPWPDGVKTDLLLYQVLPDGG